jgi:hypothetical protein
MLSNPKIFCAISHGLYDPWINILKDGQMKTWLDVRIPDDFKVVHFHGSPVNSFWQNYDFLHEKIRWTNRFVATPLRKIDNAFGIPWANYLPRVSESALLKTSQEVFHVHQPDLYVTYKWKEVGFFQFALQNFDFDYFFTTSSSSYIRPTKLIQILSNKPTRNYYAGMIPYDSATFASGSNRIFSRDVLEKVVANRSLLKPGNIEDVEIGRLIAALGIPMKSLPGKNIDSIADLTKLTNDELREHYHFRLKSGPLNNRSDVELMHSLHERLKFI